MAKGLPRSLRRANLGSQGGGLIKRTVGVDVTIDVVATGTAVGFGSAALGELGLPEGNILLLGCVANLQFTSLDANIADGWAGDFALGSAINADADLTDATDFDVLASQALAATLAVEPTTRYAAATGEAGKVIDKTAGAAPVFLNMLVDAANITDDTTGQVRVQGDISIAYTILGDD